VKKAFGESDVYVSPALLGEYRNVPLALRDEEKIDHPQLKALIAGIASYVARAKVIRPKKKILICRDAEDNLLLECCVEAKAHFLITGDRDLLEIENLPFDLKILTPRQFLAE
jgi:putative PIN family toxin of toxin-antitoxin system